MEKILAISFDEVYRRESVPMVRLALLMVGSQADLGADELADALAALSARRRAAVILRYYQDLSEAEIAEALGVRPGTVKSLLHRGLPQLRRAVEL